MSTDYPEIGGNLWGEVFFHLYSQKRDEERNLALLRGILERARSSIEALEEGVVLIDRRGNLEWWNPSATFLLGLKEQDRNQPITNFIRDPRFIEYFRRGNYKDPLDIPSPVEHNKQLQFEITTFGENDRLLVCWDTTFLRNLENMRKEFVANVSHELKTPLTVFSGYLETLLDHDEDIPPQWKKALNHMQAQAKRMTLIVNDLLTLSRLESSPNKSKEMVIDIHALLHEILGDALMYSADRQQNIKIDCDPDIQLYGSLEDIRSAFMNLVTNAIKYSPEHSTIVLFWRKESNYVAFSVIDQGHGIEPHHIPRLTERFYRIDVSRSKRLGGTGLGLAIVKHVLINHQGQLSIHSEVGKGSSFSMHFPLVRMRIREKSEEHQEDVHVAQVGQL